MSAKPVLLVVAVALVDADRRVLIAQRPEGKAMAAYGSFPAARWSWAKRPRLH